MSRRRAVGAVDPDVARLWMMLALTFSTGIADAVGYLALDRVFTGNMTGNVVILGMAIAGSSDLPIVGPGVALGGFMAGAAVAGRVLRRPGGVWTTTVTALIAAVGGMFAVTALYLALSPASGDVARQIVTLVLAGAMGVQAAAARRVAVKDVTTVVVTSTVTGLASDSWIAGRAGQPWARRLAAVLLICAGACAGAALVRIAPWYGVLASALIALTVAGAGHRLARPATTPVKSHDRVTESSPVG